MYEQVGKQSAEGGAAWIGGGSWSHVEEPVMGVGDVEGGLYSWDL